VIKVGIRHPRKRKERCSQWVGKFNPELIREKINVRNILKPKNTWKSKIWHSVSLLMVSTGGEILLEAARK